MDQSMKEVTFPSSLNEIKKCSFRGCYSIAKINIPNSMKFIRNYVFSYSTMIEIKSQKSLIAIL